MLSILHATKMRGISLYELLSYVPVIENESE